MTSVVAVEVAMLGEGSIVEFKFWGQGGRVVAEEETTSGRLQRVSSDGHSEADGRLEICVLTDVTRIPRVIGHKTLRCLRGAAKV